MAAYPETPRIDDLDSAVALFGSIGERSYEVVAFAYLDPKRRLLGRRYLHGGLDAVASPVRTIAAAALALEAYGLVMAHNHPSGDANPSARDVRMTQHLARTLRALDIILFDHLIFGRGQIVSLRAEGLL